MSELETYPLTGQDIECIIEYNFGNILEATDLISRLRAEGRIIGGYICVATLEGIPILIMALGERNAEKQEGQLEFCVEKVRRLAAHPEHVLSFQSRNIEENKFGGAVRGKRYIISFSGLPERLDELYACLVLWGFDDLSREEVESLLLEHDNPFRHDIDFDRIAAG